MPGSLSSRANIDPEALALCLLKAGVQFMTEATNADVARDAAIMLLEHTVGTPTCCFRGCHELPSRMLYPHGTGHECPGDSWGTPYRLRQLRPHTRGSVPSSDAISSTAEGMAEGMAGHVQRVHTLRSVPAMPAKESQMTHEQLVRHACSWLRRTERCCIVLREASHLGLSEIPDAIGWRSTTRREADYHA
jgi:hypothetical protein